MDPGVVDRADLLVGVLLGVGLAALLLLPWLVRGRRPGPEHAPPRTTPATAAMPPEVDAVLAALRTSTVLVDASDVVIKASPSAYSFGFVRGDRLDSEPLRRLVRQARRDGHVREAELELPRGPLGGSTLILSARVVPLGGSLVLVLIEDRTEARRVDEVRRDFVANVSHELKTPVGALSLLAEAVTRASDEPEAVRRFAERMQDETARLSRLVQELIELSRLQGADPLQEAGEVSIDDVVEEAIERCRLAAGARRIELTSGGQHGVTVLGDEDQLVTAVRNLVDNAVSYSPESTRVAIGVRRSGALVEVSVTDQGVGIPERDLERVFERFYRVDPARSRATGGTGLGLSIVKHIVVNHGGEVRVWSVEGSGSTFTLRLPAYPARAEAPGTLLPASSNGSDRLYGSMREART